jgi:type I restriction enzyme M protein
LFLQIKFLLFVACCLLQFVFEKEGISAIVSLNDIKQRDYNLNVTLYAMPTEAWEDIDIEVEFGKLKELDEQRLELEKKLALYISELR